MFYKQKELNKNALAVKQPYYKKRGCQIESDTHKAVKKLYSKENAKILSFKFKNGKSVVPSFLSRGRFLSVHVELPL